MRYLIARVFTGIAQRIQPELFLYTNLKLKQQSGLFTNLTSTVRASIASLLIANEMNTNRYYHELADNYQLLLDSGFKRSEFTYFAAYPIATFRITRSEENCQRRESYFRSNSE